MSFSTFLPIPFLLVCFQLLQVHCGGTTPELRVQIKYPLQWFIENSLRQHNIPWANTLYIPLLNLWRYLQKLYIFPKKQQNVNLVSMRNIHKTTSHKRGRVSLFVTQIQKAQVLTKDWSGSKKAQICVTSLKKDLIDGKERFASLEGGC